MVWATLVHAGDHLTTDPPVDPSATTVVQSERTVSSPRFVVTVPTTSDVDSGFASENVDSGLFERDGTVPSSRGSVARIRTDVDGIGAKHDAMQIDHSRSSGQSSAHSHIGQQFQENRSRLPGEHQGDSGGPTQISERPPEEGEYPCDGGGPSQISERSPEEKTYEEKPPPVGQRPSDELDRRPSEGGEDSNGHGGGDGPDQVRERSGNVFSPLSS